MKAREFEKQWKKKNGKATVDPKSVWDQIDSALSRCKVVIERPKNSFTIKELAKEKGISYHCAKGWVAKMRRYGEAKVAFPSRGGQPAVYALTK